MPLLVEVLPSPGLPAQTLPTLPNTYNYSFTPPGSLPCLAISLPLLSAPPAPQSTVLGYLVNGAQPGTHRSPGAASPPSSSLHAGFTPTHMPNPCYPPKGPGGIRDHRRVAAEVREVKGLPRAHSKVGSRQEHSTHLHFLSLSLRLCLCLSPASRCRAPGWSLVGACFLSAHLELRSLSCLCPSGPCSLPSLPSGLSAFGGSPETVTILCSHCPAPPHCSRCLTLTGAEPRYPQLP